MALWQFDVELVPIERLGQFDRVAIAELEEEWWSERQPPIHFRDQISAIPTLAKSWSDELWTWGREDGNRIDVWMERGQVISVYARIDCRAMDGVIIDAIENLASAWNCGLVDSHTGLVIPNKQGQLARATAGSRNRRAVEDPVAFFRDLERNPI